MSAGPAAPSSPRVVDPFLGMILSAVALATFLPARGTVAAGFHHATVVAVVALFFLHGAKLSREAVLAGIGHWRLHGVVVLTTFLIFPVFGLILRPVGIRMVGPEIYEGVGFMCALPATVQSAIVFTSIAGGNVPAAICSASLSTLIGVVLTPLAYGMTSRSGAGSHTVSLTGVRDVALHILLPFVLGHASRVWTGRWMARRPRIVGVVDRGSVVLVVYVAFSDAVVQHLWQRVSASELLGLVFLCGVLLAATLSFTAYGARLLGFDRGDRITIVFAGSKKSLASGIAMANVLFPPQLVGLMVLPLMVFHQMQLMASTVLAGRWARKPSLGPPDD
ncbi:MAG: Sodium Bile acid symporter family [Labilithrix sp.]|nr:Sodium Bile acid symporter family [Labilithrix sp.]